MAAALRGKNVAFSGTFETMKRNEVVKAAKSLGGFVNGRGAVVSKNIDVLVTGDSNVGIKKVKAKQLGIPILPASSFHRFVASGGAGRVARASAMSAAAPRPRGRPAMTPRPKKQAAFEEDFEADEFEAEEEEATVMPWETGFKAAPARRVAPKARRQQMYEEEDFEEEDSFEAAPKPRRGRPAMAAPVRRGRPPMKAIERPVRQTRATMVAPKARRATYAPFWELRGKTVAFAGSFDQIKKTEAVVMAERNGARVATGVHADIIVCGKGAEGKRMLAKKRGILPVSETSFIAACRK